MSFWGEIGFLIIYLAFRSTLSGNNINPHFGKISRILVSHELVLMVYTLLRSTSNSCDERLFQIYTHHSRRSYEFSLIL